MTCTVLSNNLPVVQYPNGARDEFGLMYTGADGFNRYLLTKRLDPVGNATGFNYFTNATTSAVCLTNVTDVDGKLTTLTYTNIGNYSLVKEVTDPYGHKAVLSYDSSTTYPVLTNITDAIGINSSILFDTTSFNLIQLSTPYTTVQFLGWGESTGGSNKDLRLRETG